MRRVVDVLVVDDSAQDAALTLDTLRSVAPDVTVLRLIDGKQALHFICATDGYARTKAAAQPGAPPASIVDLMELVGMDFEHREPR